MKIWLRIFLLSASISLAAVLITGALAVRAGYRSRLDAEVRGLLRATDAAAAVASNLLRTTFLLAGRDPTGEESTVEFLRLLQSPIFGEGTGVEIYTLNFQLVYSKGHRELPPAVGDSPELAAAAQEHPKYVLRRPASELVLYLAASERIIDQYYVFRLSVMLAGLDAYGRSQVLLLSLGALAAALLLCAAALAGSRAIARGMEGLAARAGAIAGGDYSGRAVARGNDEVAALAREFNRMADGVESAVSQLRSEKESRQAFIDDLTHELRTPVTSIVGFADHLRRRPYNEAVFSQGLTQIHDMGLRILSLSESLKRLLLSRTGSKKLKDEAVSEIVRKAAADAQARATDHTIVVDVPSSAGSLAMDRDLISTALKNLLDNALRASPPGSSITIGFARDEAARCLFVRDPGGAESASAGGLGLGKSICREIAEYHGARLEYRNEPEGGTVAMIVFPNLQ